MNSCELSDGDSIHTGEPLPYQFEPEPSPEGLWTYQMRCISDDLGCLDRGMDKVGIFDCAFIVTARRRSISLEFTHLFTLYSFGALSLRRKIWSIASYHHLGIKWVACISVCFFARNLTTSR